MFKPLIPILSDLWDHEFNEIEHISTVHAKYGCHHLQKEVADSGTDTNQKSQTSLKLDDQVPFHVTTEEHRCIYDKAFNKKHFSIFKLLNFPIVCLSKQGPPPKFS